MKQVQDQKCFSIWEVFFWQPKVAVLAVISSVLDKGAKPECLFGGAFHHHQRTPPQTLPQKFICLLNFWHCHPLVGESSGLSVKV